MSLNEVSTVVLTPQALARAAMGELVDELLAAGAQAELPSDEAVLGTAATLAEVLRIDLGYAVAALPDPDGGVLLWAERGHEVLAALAHPDGRLEIDQAGLLDGSCVDRLEALRAAASGRGLVLGPARTRPHGDPRGGALLRRSGRPAVLAAAEPQRVRLAADGL